MSARKIRTVEDLIAVLQVLTDAQRRDFGLFVDPGQMYQGRRGGPRPTEAEKRAWKMFERLGDGTLTRDQELALYAESGQGDVDAAEEASWYEGCIVIGVIAEARVDRYEPGLASLGPAIEWLESAASMTDPR